jgi:hypothetical protein
VRRPFTIELDKIVVRGSQVTVDHVGWPCKPEGLTSAQLNLPFCIATLLLEGDAFLDQFAISCWATMSASAGSWSASHEPETPRSPSGYEV